jgi:hypothetical protein
MGGLGGRGVHFLFLVAGNGQCCDEGEHGDYKSPQTGADGFLVYLCFVLVLLQN